MIHGEDEAKEELQTLKDAQEQETDMKIGYSDMLAYNGEYWHPTIITIMGQVNQALTGIGAVSVYGPQLFQLIGFETRESEYLTEGNYLLYFFMMTFAWLLIDEIGRRRLMVVGGICMTIQFALLALFAGLASNSSALGIPNLSVSIPGIICLYAVTSTFGVTWLATPMLIPTEIFPISARAQGSAVSIVVWGLANFVVTLLTPIGFNNLKYWVFPIFALSNMFCATWTYFLVPETGGRTFEENQKFFEGDSWFVSKVDDGEYKSMPKKDGDTERTPLLSAIGLAQNSN